MKPCLLFYARVTALTIALSGLCLFGACSDAGILSAEEKVRVVLPDAKNRRWRLVWYDSSGGRRTCPAEGKAVTIPLERGIFTPILLYPDENGMTLEGGSGPGENESKAIPRRFARTIPAGAIYPADAAKDLAGTLRGETSINADWTGGMLADCAQKICRSASEGFDAGRTIAAHLNWEKCRARIAGFGDPGAFDQERFVTAALAGAVTARSVAEKKKTLVMIEIAGSAIAPGTRFEPDNPLSPAFEWPQSGCPAIPLANGHFRFFSSEGVIEGEIQNDNLLCVFFAPHVLQD
jgi:hypothetical protein